MNKLSRKLSASIRYLLALTWLIVATGPKLTGIWFDAQAQARAQNLGVGSTLGLGGAGIGLERTGIRMQRRLDSYSVGTPCYRKTELYPYAMLVCYNATSCIHRAYSSYPDGSGQGRRVPTTMDSRTVHAVQGLFQQRVLPPRRIYPNRMGCGTTPMRPSRFSKTTIQEMHEVVLL